MRNRRPPLAASDGLRASVERPLPPLPAAYAEQPGPAPMVRPTVLHLSPTWAGALRQQRQIPCWMVMVFGVMGSFLGCMLGIFFGIIVGGMDGQTIGTWVGMALGAALGIWVGYALNRSQRFGAPDLNEAMMRRQWLDVEGDGVGHREARTASLRAALRDPDRGLILMAGSGSQAADGLRVATLRQSILARMYEQDQRMQQSEMTPAADGLIRILPTHRVTAEEAQQAPEEHRCCTICIEEFKRGEEQRTLPCFHRFHAACIDSWLRRSGTCPICKHRVDGGLSMEPPRPGA